MTRKELLQEHSVYKIIKSSWAFFHNSYHGGWRYRAGEYLVKHPFESTENYSRRKQLAYFFNYCAPVVDILSSYATKEPPKRSYGSLTGSEAVPPKQPETLFDKFWWNCDYEGSSFDQFMRDCITWAGVYGRISVLVDKPSTEVETAQQQFEQDIRPYLVLLTPENILDWEYIQEDGKPVLNMIKIRESKTDFKIWYRNRWELWSITDGATGHSKVADADAELISVAPHSLGRIPIVNFFNKKALERMVGISDLEDIADINRNVYSACSNANEITENTAFPMLTEAEESGTSNEPEDPKLIGPKNVLTFPADSPNARAAWIEAPHSSLTEIRKWVQQNAQEILRLAKMGGIRNVESSTQPWSGVSIEIQERQLFAALIQKTTAAEAAEIEIFSLFAEWEGTTFDGTVVYPKDFAVRDATLAIQNAMNAKTADIQSDTFDKEIQKVIVDSSLKYVDENTRDKIYEEIDVAEVVTPPVDTTGGLMVTPPSADNLVST